MKKKITTLLSGALFLFTAGFAVNAATKVMVTKVSSESSNPTISDSSSLDSPTITTGVTTDFETSSRSSWDPDFNDKHLDLNSGRKWTSNTFAGMWSGRTVPTIGGFTTVTGDFTKGGDNMKWALTTDAFDNVDYGYTNRAYEFNQCFRGKEVRNSSNDLFKPERYKIVVNRDTENSVNITFHLNIWVDWNAKHWGDEWVSCKVDWKITGLQYKTEFTKKSLSGFGSTLASIAKPDDIKRQIEEQCLSHPGPNTFASITLGKINNRTGSIEATVVIRKAIGTDGNEIDINVGSYNYAGFKKQIQTSIEDGILKNAGEYYAKDVASQDIIELLPASGLIKNTFNNKSVSTRDLAVEIKTRNEVRGTISCDITLNNGISTDADNSSLLSVPTRKFTNVTLGGFRKTPGSSGESSSNPGNGSNANNINPNTGLVQNDSSSNTGLYIGIGVGGVFY